MILDILYSDTQLLVVNKPAGIPVEEAREGASVLSLLGGQLPPLRGNNILQNVHRLDKPVSGALLIARKPSALKVLSAQFAGREVTKTYLAITDQAPAEGKGLLQNWLRKDNEKRMAIITDKPDKDAAEVKLEYEVLSGVSGSYLIQITLLTGKYHQIRAQLAHMGCPIVGDTKYGSKTAYAPDQITLHAQSLSFQHPVEHAIMAIIAPIPSHELWKAFADKIRL